MSVFIESQAADARSLGGYKTQSALEALITAAIYASIASSSLTATVSITGLDADDVQACCANLNVQGYGVSVSGSSLVLTW